VKLKVSKKIRNVQLTRSQEDYLEAIFMVSRDKKVVRVKNLVELLQVKSPSVNAALKKLREMDFISYELYGYIELTESGRERARTIFGKHQVIFYFLTEILGVSKKTAEEDACKIEHSLSKETYKNLKKLTKTYSE
jgi:DtxR family Mn-dependent transcriptional regulator